VGGVTHGEEGLLLENDGLDIGCGSDRAHVHIYLHPEQVKRQRELRHLNTRGYEVIMRITVQIA
jgi:hypothetical protein